MLAEAVIDRVPTCCVRPFTFSNTGLPQVVNMRAECVLMYGWEVGHVR